MKRKAVKSSNIASIGYDGENAILEIEFIHGGAVYQYFEVPRRLYNGLMKAKSHGVYLNKEIKPYFDYLKVK